MLLQLPPLFHQAIYFCLPSGLTGNWRSRSPILSNFFMMVPLIPSRVLQRSVLTSFHSVLSQDFGHLINGLRPWIFFSAAGRNGLGSGCSPLPRSSSSGTGVLMSCRLWILSCCWTSVDWRDLLLKSSCQSDFPFDPSLGTLSFLGVFSGLGWE